MGDIRTLDAEILSSHADDVRRYCRRRLMRHCDAEDAAQDAFVRFMLRRDQRIEDPRGWLVRAASFACAEVARTEARHRNGQTLYGASQGAPAPDAPDDAAVNSVVARTLLRELPDDERRLLVWLYVQGHSVAAVASFLRVSPGNVRVRAFRARTRARRVLLRAGCGDVFSDVASAAVEAAMDRAVDVAEERAAC